MFFATGTGSRQSVLPYRQLSAGHATVWLALRNLVKHVVVAFSVFSSTDSGA